MARSSIIKDFVSKQVDLDTTLKRLKVILDSLEYQNAIDWLDKELNGYNEKDELPSYRLLEGQVYGTYLKGTASNYMKMTNNLVPIGNLPQYLKESIVTIQVYNDIETIKNAIDKNITMGKPIPPEICSIISQAYSIYLPSATVNIDDTQLMYIIKQVEKKTLDILLKLEKEFGKLDELDIDLNSIDKVTINKVNQNIISIIYDKSVTIGSDNTIEESTFNA